MSVVPAHGQVHKREHIELRHDGEAQEHAVQEKAPAPELLVQLPLVQVNTKHLQHIQRGQRALQEAASGGEGGFAGEGPTVADLAGHQVSLSPPSPLLSFWKLRTPKSRRREVRTLK